MKLILLIAAIVCFVLLAFNIQVSSAVNLWALGVAFYLSSLLPI